MTGFGLISQDLGNVKYTVEIKSLNSKFLEL
ncbi:MAG: YicC family protein, partial [Sphingobacteriaceae bacterium]